jgi:hypothetical protein
MVIQWRLERASVKKHLPQIMRCERTVRHPMSEKGVVSSLRRKYGTGLVCLQEDVLVCGYCLVTLHRYRLELHRLVVAGRHRNAGAGTALVDALKLRVSLGPAGSGRTYSRITTVPETATNSSGGRSGNEEWD